MKRRIEKSQTDHAAKRKFLLHTRAFSTVATLWITLLVPLSCTAASIIFFNHPPTAENLVVVAAANARTRIVLKGSDPDGDPLTYAIEAGPGFGPLHGILEGAAPNLSYLPDQDFLGSDSFTYLVTDGHRSATATVSITVKKGIFFERDFDIVSPTEGNSGLTPARFTVRMTIPGSDLDLVTVRYRTIDGTAKAAEADYLATSSTLTFGENTRQTITVPVIGDTLGEFDETFLVQLFNLSPNAVFVIPTLTPSIIGLQTTTQGSVSTSCTIVNDDPLEANLKVVCCAAIGTAALTPENSVVEAGEPTTLSLDWTHPIGWRKLDSVDLLISGDEGTVLHARWHEAANAFSLLNAAADKFLHFAEAGSPARLESPLATLQLKDSTGGGLPGQTVTINYSVEFKTKAAGQTFSVEAFAIDDEGNQQGFESVGTITVLPR